MVRDEHCGASILYSLLTRGCCTEASYATDEPIPLPNVSSSVLKKLLEYLEYHKDDPLPAAEGGESEDPRRRRVQEISEWDRRYIQVDQEMLFEIILAANYLEIKPLL